MARCPGALICDPPMPCNSSPLILHRLLPSLSSLRWMTTGRAGSPEDSVTSVMASDVPCRIKAFVLSPRSRICMPASISPPPLAGCSMSDPCQGAGGAVSDEKRTDKAPARPRHRAQVRELLPVPATGRIFSPRAPLRMHAEAASAEPGQERTIGCQHQVQTGSWGECCLIVRLQSMSLALNGKPAKHPARSEQCRKHRGLTMKFLTRILIIAPLS